MKDRIDALTEVTLAIAHAAAEGNPAFRLALGTSLRRALCSNAAQPQVFYEALFWLERFERESRQGEGQQEFDFLHSAVAKTY